MIIWHNDNFIPSEEKTFSVRERILRYGDGFFESMMAVNGRVLWLPEHYARIVLSAELLKLELDFSCEKLAEILHELCKKNGLKNARFRAIFYRKGEGLYLPETNEAGVFITCSEYVPMQALNVIQKTAFFAEKKATGRLSNVKSCNALLSVMAALFAKENGLNDAILLNTDNNICEAISANIFVIRGSKVITPSLRSGCVAGVMRSKILLELNADERDFSAEELLSADAVFLTNVSYGIQAVERIGERSFDTERVQEIYAVYQKMLERELA